MNATTQIPRNRIVIGDALNQLRRLPDASVDCVVTSPPYFRLRDYAAAGQLGLESHVDEWVEPLAALTAEVHRVLVPSGTLWLNLGDTYSGHPSQGAGRKSLLMAPERLALRLQQDGWIIRNKIVWAKPNPMPTSIPDRLNTTYEVIYVLVKQSRYFFDLDAIRVPHVSARTADKNGLPKAVPKESWRGPNSDTVTGLAALKAIGRVGHPLGKNPGDVWTITPGRLPRRPPRRLPAGTGRTDGRRRLPRSPLHTVPHAMATPRHPWARRAPITSSLSPLCHQHGIGQREMSPADAM
jgi:DNA modification methylase